MNKKVSPSKWKYSNKVYSFMGNCTACSVLLTSETCGKMEENSPLCSFRGCTLLDASKAYFEMERFLLEVQKPRL